MLSQGYRRTIEQLCDVASMFWPPELSQKEAELSVIPKLLETQDQFISIISTDFPELDSLFKAVDLSKLPANLFVKHLVVLADFGGETLMRVNSTFRDFFPSGEFEHMRNGSLRSYRFKVLPISGALNNDRLGISGKKILNKQPFSDLLEDVSTILIYGSACKNEVAAERLSKCEIGNYLGKPDELAKFIKQRYIWVSRITGGAQANALGQIAQDYVKEYLQNNLKIEQIEVRRNSNLPGVIDREAGVPANFDVVVSDGSKYIGVEVSFQVTTNSTIERKANGAKARFEQIKEAGYRSAYVIDGAGNLLQRVSAVRTLCNYSHCTVAFAKDELDVLCEFARNYFLGSDSQ